MDIRGPAYYEQQGKLTDPIREAAVSTLGAIGLGDLQTTIVEFSPNADTIMHLTVPDAYALCTFLHGLPADVLRETFESQIYSKGNTQL